MSIITAPHPTLRQQAKPVTKIDKKLLQNIDLLIENLLLEKDPQGVGLAFPQINKSIRGFAFRPETKKGKSSTQVFLNPKIVSRSESQSFGENNDEPEMEGCLSIPQFYAPVPRWDWIELEYQLTDNQRLSNQQQRFCGYHARIIQHELDHLNGILFTDYVLKYDLPLYVQKGGELVPFEDKELLKAY
ncbi:MAG: Peptide deformylase [Microgenomates bacterium 39_7]|nr:MAG: Peptide deformylase [Microgenomates bacterium 39_7]